jgi:hypothetical protein
VTCTIGTLAAGASGTFTVTVNVLATATGTIVEGTYQIQSNQETPLDGPAVRTLVGCTADFDCPAGTWCNESANSCTPTLANGTALPTDATHMNPTLNGICTASAGMLVCTSAVCDTDNKCGFAVGDGPCTAQTGPVVCRSGACSVAGTCEPMGGCNVDGDCATGNWCNNLAPPGACQPKVANGQPVPGGSCVVTVATRACLSTTCVATGTLAGTCEACASDANCANPTPVCNAVSATCVGAPVEAGADGAGEDASEVDASDAATPSEAGFDAAPVDASDAGPDAFASPADASDAAPAALADAADGGTDATAAGPADATTAQSVDANDAEPVSPEEASEGEDAEASVPPPPAAGGSIEGGGLSCSMSTSPPPGHNTFLGILLGACALGVSRRRGVKP